MKLYHKLSALFMSGLMLASGLILTGCDNDELNTNPYSKAGVNLLGFGPCPLTRLDKMRITGTQLNKVNKVLFPQGNSLIVESKDYEEADFRLISNEEIEVIVPDQTVPGKLRLVAGNDTIVSVSKITFEEDIVIKDVTPTKNLRAGDVVTISGEFVWNIASVTFNDHVVVEAEDFLVNTRKEIKVVVPREAQSGDLVFSNGADEPMEVAWSEPLEIRQAVPTGLSSVAPQFGESITITGADLDLVEKVNFPLLTESSDFTVNSEGTELTTVIPVNTISGKVSLTQYSGLVVQTIAYTLPMVEYAGISPTENLKEGDAVVITGKNFDRVTAVNLPGGIQLKQGEFTQNASQIQFVVPKNMGDGKVGLVQHENYSVETDKIAMHHAGAEVPIWQGSATIGEWQGSMGDLSWGKYEWNTVKPGQVLTAYVTMNEGAGYAQIRFGDGNWAHLPSTSDAIDIAPTDDRISITLTQADIDVLVNQGGLVLCGANFTVTKVTLSVLEEVIWTGSWECIDWSGNQDLAYGGHDWMKLKEGQKIIFTIGFIDPAAESACISPRVGDNWANLPSVSQIDLKPSAEDQKVEFVPTATDITELQTKNGLVITGTGFILKQVSIQ